MRQSQKECHVLDLLGRGTAGGIRHKELNSADSSVGGRTNELYGTW